MSKKTYGGSKYSFHRKTFPLGKGGNGAVYDVYPDPTIGFPVVAKFFECDKSNRETRYKRFKREIETVYRLEDVKGILPIIDYCCPEECPVETDAAWYLMAKAEQFNISINRKIENKIDDMLCLAEIIQELHSRNQAHRDIKPENILISKGEIILSDFGLAWGLEDERLTKKMERIGPYKILPPEMEEVSLDQDIDFRPADVYLFAKVLWMYIKRDTIGFRGQYNRRDDQIYLDKHKVKVLTLEPIHRLLEQATEEYPDKRITIAGCIENLKLQQRIIKKEIKEASLIRALLFEETTKRALQRISPDVYLYDNKEHILRALETILPYSSIAIKDMSGKREVLIGTNFTIDKVSENIWRLDGYIERSVYRQLYFNAESMTHRARNTELVLRLKPIPDEEMEGNNLRSISRKNLINPTSIIEIGRFGV